MGKPVVKILLESDGLPVTVTNPDGASPILLVCEHASKTIPNNLDNLQLDTQTANSHVAWDPGALAVTKLLGEAFDATTITANFSRLVYDCNRPPEAAGAMPKKSEVYEITGNLDISETEHSARVKEIYDPFVAAISSQISRHKVSGKPVVLVTIHSFTPVYFGTNRDVELGILHDTDTRLADAMLDVRSLMNVQRNQPYGPDDGVTHTLKVHAVPDGFLNVMIEIRNDLLETETAQKNIAMELTNMLSKALHVLLPQTVSETSDA